MTDTITIYRVQSTNNGVRTTIGPVFDPNTAERYSKQGYRVTAQTTTRR